MNVSPELLMRYYDGELSVEEARRVETLIEQDAELASELQGLEQIGDVVRALSHERSERAPIDIADKVMQRIAAEAKAAPNVAQPKPAPALRRLRYWAPAAATGLALAAAFALWLRVGNAPQVVSISRSNSAETRLPPQATTAPEAVPPNAEEVAAETAQVAIESVEFGTKTGTIFVVHGEEGTGTPVVWLADDVAAKTRRMEPL